MKDARCNSKREIDPSPSIQEYTPELVAIEKDTATVYEGFFTKYGKRPVYAHVQ